MEKESAIFQKTSGRIWLRYTAVSRRSFAHSQKNTHVVTRNYSNGTRIFWFRFWVIPEPSAAVALDKGNGSSGNKTAET